MSDAEMWNTIHYCYGADLGLSEGDKEYVKPSTEDRDLFKNKIEAAESLVQFSDSIGILDDIKVGCDNTFTYIAI